MRKKKELEQDELERCRDVPMQTVPTCQTWQHMMFSAFRYALKRDSYIVGTTADYISECLECFDIKWLRLFRREIKEHLDWYYAVPKSSGEFSCDVSLWENLYEKVMTRLQKLGGNNEL